MNKLIFSKNQDEQLSEFYRKFLTPLSVMTLLIEQEMMYFYPFVLYKEDIFKYLNNHLLLILFTHTCINPELVEGRDVYLEIIF